MVALCCAVATPVQAAQGPSGAETSEAAESRGHALANENKWLPAAEALAKALRLAPGDAASRGRRNQLASEAVSAYRLAFEEVPTNCGPLTDGIALADEYLQGLSAAYGGAALLADDYGAMSKLRGELEALRDEKKCPAPKKVEETAPPPVDPGANKAGGADTVVEPPKAAPVDEPRRSSRVVPFGVGLGVSAGLTVGMAIGAGVLFSQLRKPDGSRYAAIVDAAEASGMDISSATDMCAASASDSGLADACDRWNGGYRGFLATAVLTGVFAVSTAVFTGLLIRERRAQSDAAQAWRRHQVQIGAAPQFGGATLGATFRF